VLGNGELALILDPGSIAMKSGISLSAEEESASAAESAEQADATRIEYLLVDTGGRQAAVPLGDVLRIEQLPLSRIEYIGYRPVLNFQGQLLPIEDAGGVLGTQGEPAAGGDTQIVVVVCREGNRQVGITVSHVLDVAAGGDLFEAGTSQQAGGVTLLKDRVTSVVNLGGVPALEMAAPVAEEWGHAVEAAV
jgi:two-component system chemotaxis sensor kinase CheA